MKEIEWIIITRHRHAGCVAGALSPDHLSAMSTIACGDEVRTRITGRKIRSLIASTDDYLMNCAIAEDLCRYASD